MDVWNTKLSDALDKKAAECLQTSIYKKYPMELLAMGGYLHLEVSEFIEALRGKSGDRHAEAADVLFQFLTMTEQYGLDFDLILEHLDTLNN